MEKRQKEADRKKRTKRLIEIGGVVEAVLEREFEDGDKDRLYSFLKMQEKNGSYFSKAMNKGTSEEQISESP